MNKTYTIERPPLTPTFDLPKKETLLTLKKGFFVKLIFADTKGKNKERMWIKLTKTNKTNQWEGTLNNIPYKLQININQKITFHPLDIIDILPPVKNHTKGKKLKRLI
jgi:hypothetical protein